MNDHGAIKKVHSFKYIKYMEIFLKFFFNNDSHTSKRNKNFIYIVKNNENRMD